MPGLELPCAAAQKQGERFLCGRAELIDELETAAPSWLRRRNAAAWVHFLKARAAWAAHLRTCALSLMCSTMLH